MSSSEDDELQEAVAVKKQTMIGHMLEIQARKTTLKGQRILFIP
jgi:hypothetical protein